MPIIGTVALVDETEEPPGIKIDKSPWEINGHDAVGVYNAIMARRGKQPFFLVGKTVKGRGISYMEHVPIWHYRSPSKEEYQKALAELKEVAS